MRCGTRRGLSWAIVVAPVLALAFALPSVAAADTTISGPALGLTMPQHDGGFRIFGTYRDVNGFPGTYSGSYSYQTTGFDSCRAVGIGSINCGTPTFPYRCNLILGQVTFRSVGRQVTVFIGAGGFDPPAARLQSGICTQEADPAIHDTYLLLLNRTASQPATTEEFSHGYGILAFALGTMTGTSTPLGASPLYVNRLALNLSLISQT
jgi:hypothetical protein